MDVLSKVRETVNKYGLFRRGDGVVVGVSGGPDSLCLLHVLVRLQDEYRLRLHVAHLNHLIRGADADADAAFVAELAARWGLPATVEAIDVPAYAAEHRFSLEEAARRVRYQFLARVAQEVGAVSVAVGHNADDQVETIVMHWLRGSGLAGLRGMLPLSPLAPDSPLRLVRPLLEVTRSEIEAYCARHGLTPRFDRSNLDTTYFRNRLRLELIPYLETYNPDIRRILRRMALVLADDYDYLRGELLRIWPQVVKEESLQAITFDLAAWRALHPSLRRATLREAIRRLRRALRNIDWIHIENAHRALMDKGTGTRVTLPQGLELRIGYHDFIIAPEGYIPLPEDIPLLFVESLPVSIPGLTPLPDSQWVLETRILRPEDLPSQWDDNPDPWQAFLDHERTGSSLLLRRRLPGDRLRPLGLGGTKKLNELMIDVKIPAVWRNLWPILASPQGIVWVPGVRIDERARITQDTRRVLWARFRKQTSPQGHKEQE